MCRIIVLCVLISEISSLPQGRRFDLKDTIDSNLEGTQIIDNDLKDNDDKPIFNANFSYVAKKNKPDGPGVLHYLRALSVASKSDDPVNSIQGANLISISPENRDADAIREITTIEPEITTIELDTTTIEYEIHNDLDAKLVSKHNSPEIIIETTTLSVPELVTGNTEKLLKFEDFTTVKDLGNAKQGTEVPTTESDTAPKSGCCDIIGDLENISFSIISSDTKEPDGNEKQATEVPTPESDIAPKSGFGDIIGDLENTSFSIISSDLKEPDVEVMSNPNNQQNITNYNSEHEIDVTKPYESLLNADADNLSIESNVSVEEVITLTTEIPSNEQQNVTLNIFKSISDEASDLQSDLRLNSTNSHDLVDLGSKGVSFSPRILSNDPEIVSVSNLQSQETSENAIIETGNDDQSKVQLITRFVEESPVSASKLNVEEISDPKATATESSDENESDKLGEYVIDKDFDSKIKIEKVIDHHCSLFKDEHVPDVTSRGGPVSERGGKNIDEIMTENSDTIDKINQEKLGAENPRLLPAVLSESFTLSPSPHTLFARTFSLGFYNFGTDGKHDLETTPKSKNPESPPRPSKNDFGYDVGNLLVPTISDSNVRSIDLNNLQKSAINYVDPFNSEAVNRIKVSDSFPSFTAPNLQHYPFYHFV